MEKSSWLPFPCQECPGDILIAWAGLRTLFDYNSKIIIKVSCQKIYVLLKFTLFLLILLNKFFFFLKKKKLVFEYIFSRWTFDPLYCHRLRKISLHYLLSCALYQQTPLYSHVFFSFFWGGAGIFFLPLKQLKPYCWNNSFLFQMILEANT